ncbi:glycoside hydrolase family protein [Maricaulis virginensis]|uniref:Lysozyme n=1 Tax=Maricaulis virginensis TaxID=144022 RepID=A0A9W6IKJ4_9PROT|nr:hypothetical protein [Maricaulis virginensis]GLK50964.1 hypothetical protein GCM10017621_04720 [Maricaulis virginensis]
MTKPQLKSSPAARELIKRFEPFRETAIRGADGRWVVGYGHRAAARGGIKVSEEEASLLLIYDVMQAETAIDEIADIPLARGQRDALVSFIHDIGRDAFRNSDVARYLYEGRLDAAAEALAAHGDGTSARREAESRAFLDAMVPARAERPAVELVIKVEHPREERVLEGAIAGGRDEPVEDYAPPPPPPMPDRRISSRAEAEAEIARILATVEAMPLEEREALADDHDMASVEAAVSDMSDAPVEAAYEAVEEDGAPAEDLAEAAGDAAVEPVIEAPAIGAETVTDTPEALVAARMSEELAEAGDDEPGSAEPAFALPADTTLGFALTAMPGLEAIDADEAVPEAPAAAVPAAEQAAPVPQLPLQVELGYAFTSVMTARFRPNPTDGDVVLPVAQPETEPEAVETAAEDAESAVEDEVTTPVEAEPAPEVAITEIVERAVAVAGQDTPPPHASNVPAESHGAVGEVEGERVEVAEAETENPHDDLLDGDDPLTRDADEDSFSPRDLAADLPPEVEEKPVGKSDDGSWGYIASLAAGAVVTAFGAVMTWGDWGRMWSERSLTGDAWALIAGVFLMLAAAWSLGSVWLERLKKNRRVPAEAR